MRTRNVLAVSAAFLLACGASSNDRDTGDSSITADELRTGASWNGQESEADDDPAMEGNDPVDPGDSGAADADATSPVDDAGAGDDASAGNVGTKDLGTSSCMSAQGYRKGSPMTICVTEIDGKPVEQATATALLSMRHAAAQAGVNIHVVSGFRTMAEQRHLYALYKEGRGNLAAPPGFSNHQSGHALDLNTKAAGVYSWLAKHGAAYGFGRTVPSEAWHWEHW